MADFIEATHYWNACSAIPATSRARALASVVRLMRLGVFERRSPPQLASRENAALYIDFVNRVADRVASYIVRRRCATTVRSTRYHEHVYETFYVLILGIVSYAAPRSPATRC